MDFNDIANNDGLIQQCEINLFGDSPFGKISGNSSRLAIFTNFMNDAYSRYVILALLADNSWQFDDNNYTDFPIGSTNLVANQPDYTLNTDQIIVDQVEVLDTTGTIWQALPELDQRKFAEFKSAQSQFNNNIAARPQWHVKMGNSIYLYPTPSYSITLGLRVRFKRPPSYFAVTDTTKKPGITRLHHSYLSDYATWRYGFARGMPIYKNFEGIVTRWEKEDIPSFYMGRSSEHPTIIKSIIRSSR